MFKSKNKIIIIISSVIILMLLGLLFFIPHKTIVPEIKTISTNINKPTNPIGKTYGATTTLEINSTSYTNTITGKMSVYDFMSKLRNEGKINFTETNYIGMGEFIDSINGIKNNNNLVWIYYVNGVEAQIGISNYKINPGDVVSWKYEKSNY